MGFNWGSHIFWVNQPQLATDPLIVMTFLRGRLQLRVRFDRSMTSDVAQHVFVDDRDEDFSDLVKCVLGC